MGPEDSMEEGTGNPPQYSCLESRMDRRAWRAIVYGVEKNWTGLKRVSMHTHLKKGRMSIENTSCTQRVLEIEFACWYTLNVLSL